MPIKKDKIVIGFDQETLIELKKVLFSKGISVQGFFSYISELVSMRDPRIDFLFPEAPLSNEHKKGSDNDANALYAQIERELLKKQNGV